MKALRDILTDGSSRLFVDAQQLPDFFQNNLVDPARVVKAFYNDPQANIRIFYFQYLKLCFELETVNYEHYIKKMEEIINNESFKFIFGDDDEPSLFNDMQFKHLITEFFGLLGEGQYFIEEAINYYPFMDTVFIYFFRSFLILVGKADAIDSYIERGVLFNFLCSFFEVEIHLHDKCLKFVETDIFVYEEDPKAVFMAYMEDQPEELTDSTQKAQPIGVKTNFLYPLMTGQPLSESVDLGHPKAHTLINKSYIASEFEDYTQSKSNANAAIQNSSYLTNQHHQSCTLSEGKSPTNTQIQGDFKQEQDYGSNMYRVVTPMNKIEDQRMSKVKKPQQEEIKTEQQVKYPSSNSYQSTTNKMALGSQFLKKTPAMSTSLDQTQEETAKYPICFVQAPPNLQNAYSPYSVNCKVDVRKPESYQTGWPEGNSKKHVGSDAIREFPSIRGSNNPYGLNVTQQFTSSFTRRAMAEPFRSTVENIRSRARQFRSSLVAYMK